MTQGKCSAVRPEMIVVSGVIVECFYYFKLLSNSSLFTICIVSFAKQHVNGLVTLCHFSVICGVAKSGRKAINIVTFDLH